MLMTLLPWQSCWVWWLEQGLTHASEVCHETSESIMLCYVMLFYEASISYLLSEDSNCIYFMKLLELNGVSDKVVSSVSKYYL